MGEFIGREVELEVSKIAHGGIAVGRLDGRVVFVTDADAGRDGGGAHQRRPQEELLARRHGAQSSSRSEHRREHVWSAASIDRDPRGRAGGAEFGHIALSHQRELKRQVLAEALQRMAGIESDVKVEQMPGDHAAERHSAGARASVCTSTSRAASARWPAVRTP